MARPQCDTLLVNFVLIENVQDIYNTWALRCYATTKDYQLSKKMN
jgi:hypothetical protein